MSKEIIASLVLFLLFILFLLPNFKIVKDNEHLLIERMGSFFKVIQQPGLYFMMPLFDRVIERQSILPQERTLKGESFSIVYTYKITDIKMYGYYALDPIRDLENYLASLYLDGTPDFNQLKETIKDRGIELLELQEVTNNNF